MTAKDLAFEEISEGDRAFLEREIGEEEISAFAALTLDTNPLHMDEAYAASTPFGGRIAHGMILASFVSTLVGMELPGKRAVFVSQSTEFRKPVRPGDRIRLELKVLRKVAATRMLEMAVTAMNQKGETVMTGTAKVLVRA